MSELLKKIRLGGHWRVIVRPSTFEKNRIPSVSELYPLLERTSVRLRGRAFPIVRGEQPLELEDHIGYEEEDSRFAELWRFYQSGQLIQYSAFIEDRLDPSKIEQLPPDWKPGLYVDPVQVLFRATEIFEFATRLTFTPAADHQTHLEVSVSGIKGRTLKSATGMSLGVPIECSLEESVSLTYDFANLQLVSNNRVLALKMSRDLFMPFGWNPSLSLLKDLQRDLLEKSPWAANAI